MIVLMSHVHQMSAESHRSDCCKRYRPKRDIEPETIIGTTDAHVRVLNRLDHRDSVGDPLKLALYRETPFELEFLLFAC